MVSRRSRARKPQAASPTPSGTPVRGRGTALNPANRFEGLRLEVLPEAREEAARQAPNGGQVPTRVYVDATRRVINRVDSADLNFRWTINPYRGCAGGCCYCFARPTHETLGFSCGLDFETKIVAKPEAPRLLRKELASPRWKGEPIVMSGVTDAYQPLEKKMRITRGCLEVMAEFRQPVSIVTKRRLITRDLDHLTTLAASDAVSTAVSLTTLDPHLSAVMEPRASSPQGRLRAIRELAGAGIPVGVMVAPVIPGLNDREIPRILEAAADAGASAASWIMLRLPHQVKTIFLDWLKVHFPHRASRIEGLIRELHGGQLYDSSFGVRQRGRGVVAEQIAATFRMFSRRYRLDRAPFTPSSASFRSGEPSLFDQLH